MNFDKYKNCKDSGEEWLFEIPEDWKMKRVKDIAKVNPPTKSDRKFEDEDKIDFLPMTNVDEVAGKIKLFNQVNYSEVKNGYTKFRNGDVLFAKITPCMENGNCVIVETLKHNLGFGSTEFIVFRTNRHINRRYFHYFVRNNSFRAKAEQFMIGTAGQKRISTFYLTVHDISYPPIQTQKTIAEYLDTKTEQIDKKIDILQTKKEKYKELRKTIINQAVTKGLDKNAELKDSGVEWIGKIPKHWEVRRIKDFTYVKGRIGWQGLKSDEFIDNSDYFCITGTDFKNGEVDWKNCYGVEEFRYEQDKFIQLKKNDLLITKDGTIGKIALIKYLPKKTTLNSGVFVTRPLKRKYENSFMFWLLSSSVFKNFIDFTKNGSTILHLYQNVFERFFYALPPTPEQLQIVKYLEEKASKIDHMILTIDKNIETLNEFRKTLINDAVTGKIKVV